MPPIRVLEVGGTPYEMGYRHGQTFAREIRELAAERVHLCTTKTWTGLRLPRRRVLELAEACVPAHYEYAPDLMAELEGMSMATGLSLAELVIVNGFTDFVDAIYNVGEKISAPTQTGNECTAFLVNRDATADGHAFLGQTWDMHATASPYVILLRARPDNGPAYLTFTLTGSVAMIGLNEAGIAVGINNLVGADGQIGVTWPFVCRKILAQTTLDDALACITSARLAGGHNYLLADSAGRGFNVEAMSTACHITTLDDSPIVHTNICLAPATQAVERELSDDLVADSQARRERAAALLQERPITPETLMALTRDHTNGEHSICSTAHPPYYSETCGAAIMRPATREFWAVWGLPSENEYERLVV